MTTAFTRVDFEANPLGLTFTNYDDDGNLIEMRIKFATLLGKLDFPQTSVRQPGGGRDIVSVKTRIVVLSRFCALAEHVEHLFAVEGRSLREIVTMLDTTAAFAAFKLTPISVSIDKRLTDNVTINIVQKYVDAKIHLSDPMIEIDGTSRPYCNEDIGRQDVIEFNVTGPLNRATWCKRCTRTIERQRRDIEWSAA